MIVLTFSAKFGLLRGLHHEEIFLGNDEMADKFTCLNVAFKNNGQLKTNTALQMEAEKIDFKVI